MVDKQRLDDEQLWSERLRAEIEKNAYCSNCEQLTHRMDMIVQEMPEE